MEKQKNMGHGAGGREEGWGCKTERRRLRETALSLAQFIRTSIWTSLALVSPAMRYGIIPAKVISARAWLRSSCAYRYNIQQVTTAS